MLVIKTLSTGMCREFFSVSTLSSTLVYGQFHIIHTRYGKSYTEFSAPLLCGYTGNCIAARTDSILCCVIYSELKWSESRLEGKMKILNSLISIGSFGWVIVFNLIHTICVSEEKVRVCRRKRARAGERDVFCHLVSVLARQGFN